MMPQVYCNRFLSNNVLQGGFLVSGEGHKAAKQHVRQQKLAGISKVVGVSKLRTKYEAPEAKRQLCSSYDIFLADERVIPSLPKLLGKSSRSMLHMTCPSVELFSYE